MNRSSIYYFVYFIGTASLSPFLSVFYKGLGLTGSQIGILTGLSPLLAFFSASFWTGLADATHRHKLIFVLSVCGAVIAAFALTRAQDFSSLIVIVICFSFLSAPILALFDSATLAQLGDKHDHYGSIRMWGTIGWAVSAPIAGQVAEHFGIRISFGIYIVALLAGLFIVWKIPFLQTRSSLPFFNGVRELFSNRAFITFLGAVFISGVGMASVSSFLFIYLQSLGASKTLMGFSLTISTISEVPVMLFSRQLLKRFSSRQLLIVAMSVIGLRLITYSFVTSPVIALAIQLVHGFTNPLIWVAGVSLVYQTAPKGMSASAQGIFSGTLNGVGVAAGSLLCGILLDRWGLASMYRTLGALVLVGMFFYLMFGHDTKNKI